MKISDSGRSILVDKLSFLKDVDCVCGSKKWIVNEAILELREFNGGGLIIGGSSSVMPVVSVQCENCGHTLFFNAIPLGIITNKNEKTKK